MTARPRTDAAALIRAGLPVDAAPWTRYVLTDAQWAALVERLRSDPLPLAGLWSDGDAVHVLLLEAPDTPLLASVPVERKRFLALSPVRPHASVPERVLRDLWGIEAMGALDLRPWLDHGAWGQTAPLSSRPGPAAWPPEPPEFIWTALDEAAGLMQLPLGPVQTLLLGPAQLRITLLGERIARLEPLLGFNHRGVAGRLRGLLPAEAALLVARIDATASVAHQSAFAQAVEAANGWQVDGASRSLRLAMGALERIGLRLRQSGAQFLRSTLLDACGEAFGHRLMQRSIAPGGWAAMPREAGLAAVHAALAAIESAGQDAGPPDAIAAIRRDLPLARRNIGVAPGGPGPDRAALPGSREGLAVADSLRGPVWHWVRLDNGRIAAWHAVDPTLLLLSELAGRACGLPLHRLEALCASFDLSVAGADQ